MGGRVKGEQPLPFVVPRPPSEQPPARRNTVRGRRWRTYLAVSVTVSDDGAYAVWVSAMAPGDRVIHSTLLEALPSGASDNPSALAEKLLRAAREVGNSVHQTGALP